jgi:hypothetical protein
VSSKATHDIGIVLYMDFGIKHNRQHGAATSLLLAAPGAKWPRRHRRSTLGSCMVHRLYASPGSRRITIFTRETVANLVSTRFTPPRPRSFRSSPARATTRASHFHFSFSHPPSSKESGSARTLCVLTVGWRRERLRFSLFVGLEPARNLSLPLVGRRAFCNSRSRLTDCAPPCTVPSSEFRAK